MQKNNLTEESGLLALGAHREILVKPGMMRLVSLGHLPREDADPDYSLAFSPEMEEDIGISSSRLGDKNGDLITYMFHNFGHQACTVTITRIDNRKAM
jgi:hypothetical protein